MFGYILGCATKALPNFTINSHNIMDDRYLTFSSLSTKLYSIPRKMDWWQRMRLQFQFGILPEFKKLHDIRDNFDQIENMLEDIM